MLKSASCVLALGLVIPTAHDPSTLNGYHQKRTPQGCGLAVKLEGSNSIIGYANSVRVDTVNREVYVDFLPTDIIFCDGFDENGDS